MSSFLLVPFLSSARAADYTGDGIDDLLVGVPFEDIDGKTNAGGVEVIRGSSSGLTTIGDAFLHQDVTGVSEANEDGDNFGFGLGAGDLENDGTADLIVGGPREVVSGLSAGGVWRLELTATLTGLSVSSSQAFTEDTSGVTGTSENLDDFGYAVAVADFDGDGYDDVVVGTPDEGVGTLSSAGAVTFLPAGPAGLTTSGHLYYDQSVANVGGTAKARDYWGATLAAGDFDDDGYADLAIGSPGDDVYGGDEGSVQVMYGSSTGPSVVSPDDEFWSAGLSSSIAGTFDEDNYCGNALSVGDFDDDGYDDLAIACPGYDVPLSGGATVISAGAVLVVYGSSSGLDGSEIWTQDSPGVLGTAEEWDFLGGSDWWRNTITSGDYDGDGYDDLAIGAPWEDYSFTDSGVVHVLFGSSSGITADGNLLLAQDTGSTVEGTPSASDDWGWTLATGDWNDDGRDDLAVASPFDDESGVQNAGAVNVFYGSASGPSTSGDQLFDQDTSGINDSCEEYDAFGFSLR